MGAKFSGGGATVFYDDGIKTAASGTTGTQRNEFEAAIKSVTSSTTVGAVFLYDTSQDSDGGKWRKKTSHTSWAREASSATRSARSEFPAMALIVADNASGAETVTIYDLDDVAAPVWMVFSNTGSLTWATSGSVIISSLHALNGRLYVGHNHGFIEYNFAGDDSRLGNITAYQLTSGRTIVGRNTTSSWATGGDGYLLVNSDVNDVSATILEGAEIGALGLPIPTVAVATDGGVSVIHPSGDVYNLTNASGNNDSRIVFFTDDGKIGLNYEQSGSSANATFCGLTNIPYSNLTLGIGSSIWLEEYQDNRYPTGLACTTLTYTSASSEANAIAPMSKDGLALGYPDRLSIVKRNTGNGVEGAVAYITSTYNTGYMVGDIRGAWLARGTKGKEDRTVKGNDLTVTETAGALTSDVVATDAEMVAISNFSANRYLSKAYDASLDLGTTCTVMAWVKVDLTSTGYQTVAAYNSASRVNGWQLLVDGSEQPYFYVYGASADVTSGVASAITDTGWHFLVGVNDGSKSYIYVDGKLGNSTAGVAGSMNNGTGRLSVGILYNDTLPWDDSLSLVRVSATASTPQQIADIYAAEKPLFAAGAKCLLQSTYSGGNEVRDLSFDKSTGLLAVAQGNPPDSAGVQYFRNLEMVKTFDGSAHGWTYGGANIVETSGGVQASVRTSGGVCGVLVDLPALDVRAELNDGESKLPDDGKLHFEGVTTDATPTVIGFVPIQQNEDYLVRLAVNGKRYQVHESSYFIDGRIEERFFRRLGGSDVETSGETLKLVNEGQAALDFDLTVSTGGSDSPASVAASAGYIMLRVTGAAGTRIVWKASVEVQRISEKTYER